MQIDIQIDHILRRESGGIEVSIIAEYHPEEKATHEVPAVPDVIGSVEVWDRSGKVVEVEKHEVTEILRLLQIEGRRAVSERGEG